MRRPAAEYLEEAKVDELVAELESKGFRIARQALLGDERVDLLAERNGERRAYAVKAISRLKDSTQELERLRAAARHARLDGFIVVVATPPHKVDVTIDNLRSELLNHFVEHDVAARLDGPPVMIFEDVVDIVIEAIDVHPARVRVRGKAYIDVQVDEGPGPDGDESFAIDSYPFTFDVDLDPDLKIVEMHDLSVNTNP